MRTEEEVIKDIRTSYDLYRQDVKVLDGIMDDLKVASSEKYVEVVTSFFNKKDPLTIIVPMILMNDYEHKQE